MGGGRSLGEAIVRTVGEELTKQTFERELKSLLGTWKQIQRRASRGRASTPIPREAKLTKGIIRDLFSGKVDSLTIDSPPVFEEVRQYLDQVDPSLIERVKLFDEPVALFDKYEIEAAIQRYGIDCEHRAMSAADRGDVLERIEDAACRFGMCYGHEIRCGPPDERFGDRPGLDRHAGLRFQIEHIGPTLPQPVSEAAPAV